MLLEAVPWHAEPDLLVNIYSARQEWFDSPGVGKDVRIEGEKLTGTTWIVEGRPVHLELFREEAERRSTAAPAREPARPSRWKWLFCC